jgi:hypothetical protein
MGCIVTFPHQTGFSIRLFNNLISKYHALIAGIFILKNLVSHPKFWPLKPLKLATRGQYMFFIRVESVSMSLNYTNPGDLSTSFSQEATSKIAFLNQGKDYKKLENYEGKSAGYQ